MIRSVILDFDGVVLESADIKTRAFETLFAAWPDRLDEIRRYHLDNSGISRHVKIRHIRARILALTPEEAEERLLADRFAALVDQEVLAARFVPGALEFVGRPGRRLLFVASGTPEEELRRIIAARGLASAFAGVFGSPRTKPAIIRQILLDHDLGREEIVFVGDGPSDEAASKETGVPFVARLHPGGALTGGRWQLHDLTELEPILSRIEHAGAEAQR